MSIENKNCIALVNGKLVVNGCVFGENIAEALLCCGNCKHYDPCSFNGDVCKFSMEFTLGDSVCDKWEIVE